MWLTQKSVSFQAPYSAIAKLGIACLLVPMTALAASAQLSVEETLNHFFWSDAPMPGANLEGQENRLQLRATVTQWLGDYQGVRAEDEYYSVLFERGSVPVTVQFRENGDPDSITVVDCPVTSVPISQAPAEYRNILSSDCPDLTP